MSSEISGEKLSEIPKNSGVLNNESEQMAGTDKYLRLERTRGVYSFWDGIRYSGKLNIGPESQMLAGLLLPEKDENPEEYLQRIGTRMDNEKFEQVHPEALGLLKEFVTNSDSFDHNELFYFIIGLV